MIITRQKATVIGQSLFLFVDLLPPVGTETLVGEILLS